MFTRLSFAIAHIKLGLKIKKLKVKCVPNKLIKKILRKLILDGFLNGFSYIYNKPYYIEIYLKYDFNLLPIIKNIKLISTAGHRVYFKYRQVIKAYKKGHYFLLSTTKGLFTITEIMLYRLKIGGEVILQLNFL